MADSGYVSAITWNNTNKTGETDNISLIDYFKVAKDREAQQLANTSVFTYATSYRG